MKRLKKLKMMMMMVFTLSPSIVVVVVVGRSASIMMDGRRCCWMDGTVNRKRSDVWIVDYLIGCEEICATLVWLGYKINWADVGVASSSSSSGRNLILEVD